MVKRGRRAANRSAKKELTTILQQLTDSELFDHLLVKLGPKGLNILLKGVQSRKEKAQRRGREFIVRKELEEAAAATIAPEFQ